jgi:hypothetical protein
MSTYVVSMIEVFYNGKWELLRSFKRDDYIKYGNNCAFPKDKIWKMSKDYVEDNEESTTIGYIENSLFFNDDYFFQSFLLDSDMNNGYIHSDFGMPDDVSSLTVKRYEEYGPNASIPSYYMLKDLQNSWRELVKKFRDDLPKAQKDCALSDINKKLGILLSLSGVKGYEVKNKEQFDEYRFNCSLDEIILIHEEIMRIRTLVESQYGDVDSKDVRVIWFIY